jgi:uncharacterized protein YcbX
MPHVAALYRYPVKGFTPEECETLTVLDEGRIAGDRVLGVRFADTEAADDAWSRKTGMVALINTPGLARLSTRFDETALRLRISLGTAVLVDEELNPPGRKRIAAVLADYHDEEAGRVTLHGRGSLQALQTVLGAEVSELRFRSNISVDGLSAWEEQGWVGRKIRIGAVEFDVVKPKTRCLATHAHPVTGERDLAILTTLTQKIGQENPTFAVAMLPSSGGGRIHVGDQVTLLD